MCLTQTRVNRFLLAVLTLSLACALPEPSTTVAVTATSARGGAPGAEHSDGAEGRASDPQTSPDEECCVIGRLSDMVDVPTQCEVAYNKAAEMVEAIRTQDPSIPPLVPRELFETECARLPATYQPCLNIDHAMAHADECNAVLRSPEVQAFRET
ncbi:MAG: hypothetical protein ACI9KE_004728, partial [Polyangiales bacterium]